MYLGTRTLQMTNEQIVRVYEGFNDFSFITNEYLIMQDEEGKTKDRLRWTGKEFVKISYKNIKELRAKSDKQMCLFDLLSNPNIPIKIIAGVPGSGKTRIAVSYGLYFINNHTYSNIFVVRHNVGVGEKNGYLKGDKYEKIRGWLGFLEDNLVDTQYTIDELYDRGMLKFDGVEFMKGRDLKDSFILVDECEDLTEEEFKMLGERPSGESQICFIGDYEQTTQEKYKKSSGLIRAIDKLAGNPKVGIIVFDDKYNDNVRGEVSKIFTYLY